MECVDDKVEHGRLLDGTGPEADQSIELSL